MNTKKWVISLLCLLVLSVLAFALIMFFTDPLLQYGTEQPLFSYYEYNEIYSNPGIAKNYTYDTVLVGTSMIQNTNVDECDELLGCNTVRLPYSGGTTYNMKKILDICFDSPNKIRRVLWELDQFQILGSSTEPRYPLPEYLYNETYTDDASYLLNLDIFYHHTVNNLLGTLQGRKESAERRGDTLFGEFSKESMLRTYSRPPVSSSTVLFSELKQSVDANLNQNILPLVRENRDTTFTFFFVPFSVLYWDSDLRNGRFDAVMDATLYTIQALLEYKNVEVYFFQDQWEIATNLDHYKDFSHYGPWINSYMTKSIAAGEERVTVETCVEIIESMRAYIHSYDFDSIFIS